MWVSNLTNFQYRQVFQRLTQRSEWKMPDEEVLIISSFSVFQSWFRNLEEVRSNSPMSDPYPEQSNQNLWVWGTEQIVFKASWVMLLAWDCGLRKNEQLRMKPMRSWGLSVIEGYCLHFPLHQGKRLETSFWFFSLWRTLINVWGLEWTRSLGK